MATELAFRENDGVEVALLWHPDTNELTVDVFDGKAGDDFSLAVAPKHAMDAFHHPYAYAAQRGIAYNSGTREPTYA